MDKRLQQNFGFIIREMRSKRNLSQESFAFKAGVHRTYIGMIERGEKNITLENINKLAKALDVPISDIFRKLEDLK
jgi:transcriptional regulator with XRE-family HTH domain